MNAWIIRMAILAGMTATGAAQAEATPLSADGLARCASQVQNLRTESVRLIQQSSSFDAKREAINRRTQNLDAQAAALDPNDMAGSLELAEVRKRHNQETMAFNAQVEQLRREIVSVNQVKHDYDSNCSDRPYRRADLDRLPEPARNAMRIGLSDVSVPYLDGPMGKP